MMKSLLLFLLIGCCIAYHYHLHETCDMKIGMDWTNKEKCNEWYSTVFILKGNQVETCMRAEPRSCNEIIIMIRKLSHPKSRFKIEKVESYLKTTLQCRSYGLCIKYYEDINVAHDFIAYHFQSIDLPTKKKLVRDIHHLLVSNDDCK